MRREDSMKIALDYFDQDALAAQVYIDKYALTTPDGDILEPSPDDMHKRLAKEFSRIESRYPNALSESEIYQLLKNFKYIIPQGGPLAGIGNPYQTISLSNCFVIDSPMDSYSGILFTDQEQAQIMKRRGGVGFDISKIRPKNLKTNNAAKTTDGIGVFMERFSNTCREVAQGGRRGALMLTISVHHPEIETFINIKKDLKKVTGANLSIRLSDEFMNAVEREDDVELRFPVDSINPKISQKVSAKNLWNKIIESAHGFAEPGLLFWDTVNRRTPSHCYEDFVSISTNPCAELLLSKYDSCRLLLINTLSFVENPFSNLAKFDFKKFENVAISAQRLMDDLIDLEVECIDKILAKIDQDPEPEIIKKTEKDLWLKIKQACLNGRRTGLGVTAIGDMLAALNVRYGSDESIDLVESVYKTLAVGAYKSTVQLAKERGAFPVFDFSKEKNHEFLLQIMNEDEHLKKDWENFGRRNIALTTTAPAGTVSILTQTTSGIEPAFEVVYLRRRKVMSNEKDVKIDFIDDLGDKWQQYEVYHPQFKKWMEISKKTKVEESPYYKARANDVDWVAKVKLQAAAQKWVCHSISNTTNIPKDTTTEVVKDIYMTGWKSGCKGVTVYRDGCRDGVLLTSDESSKKTQAIETHAPKRPLSLDCDVMNFTVAGEKWTFFVGKLNNKPYEIMGGLSKYIVIPKRVKCGKIIKQLNQKISRYDFHYDYEENQENETVLRDINTIFENVTNGAFTRIISLALRHGAPIQFIVEQLNKGSEKDDDLFSFSRAVSRVLKQYIKDGTRVNNKLCPSCEMSDLAYQEGCLSCKMCGFSKCG
jgi:ribonucleoside-diphosphate reductase alpha chain